ncbi:acyltransferase family protein [Lichenibacterium ramalinae]|uniref:Acyltransferase n=1 Tax=Lichenibacterium ramalinae TaxID=2316527 RepID=A0A4Q2R9K2_9HYPH|nr:acyltransferase [Lichenibacterium ramalinae]RYB02196.1 acyltransferase [Lichenibacterium ramalinae]
MTDLRRTGPDRRNSFDVVRLIAALSVVLAHQLNIAGYALPGYGQPSIGLGGPKLADAGLYVFFALSGYLVFQSLDADPRTGRFLSARALRIYPGVVVNVAMCTVVGAIVSTLPASAYWGAAETWRFLVHNATILVSPTEFQLPGVLTESPWPSVNVPLWTLKYEILCYVVLLIVFKATGGSDRIRAVVLTVLTALAVGWFVYDRGHPPPATGGLDTLGSFSGVHVVRFFAVFLSGATCGAWRLTTPRRRLSVTAVIGLALATTPTAESRFVVAVLAIGLGGLMIGSSRLLFSRAYHGFGDLSYGTYLYAFPIQMFTMTHWLNAENFWGLTALDVLLALACAALSWRFVERPALRWKQGRRHGPMPDTAPLAQPV